MVSHPQIKLFDTTVFAECPSCLQMIKAKSFTDAVMQGERNCPFCNFSIGKYQIVASCELYLIKMQTLRAAFAMLFVTIGAIICQAAFVYFDFWEKYNFIFFLILVLSVIFLLAGYRIMQKWLSGFNRTLSLDPDFITIKKKVRNLKIVWVWANIANLLVWFVLIKYF